MEKLYFLIRFKDSELSLENPTFSAQGDRKNEEFEKNHCLTVKFAHLPRKILVISCLCYALRL